MATLANLIVRVGGDTSGLEKSMKSAQDTLKNFGRQAREIGRRATTFITAPLAAAGGTAIKFASDVEEMQSKSRQVFKDQIRDVKKWASTVSDEINRSRFQVQKFAGNIQDVLVPMGFARDRATELSEQITELAFDVASFNNQADERVLQNFKSALVGNSRSVLDYGINVRKTAVDQELMNMGIKEGFEAATQQQKVLARLNLMLADTRDAQGDAARTANSFKNTMKGVTGLLHETAVTFGQILIPPAKDFLTTFVIPAITFVKDLAKENKEWIVTIAAIAAAIGPALIALGSLATVLGVVLPAVLSPLGLLFTGVAGVLTAEVVRLWDSQKTVWENLVNLWETAKSRALAIWVPLKNAAVFVFQSLMRFWERWRDSVFNIIGGVVNFFRNFGSTIVNTVLKAFGMLISAGESLLNMWQSLSPEVKKTAVVVGTLAVVFGVLLGPIMSLVSGLGSFASIFGILMTTMSGGVPILGSVGLALGLLAPKLAAVMFIVRNFWRLARGFFSFLSNPAVAAVMSLATAAFMLWDSWNVIGAELRVLWTGLQLKLAKLKAAILSWIAEAAVPLINFAQKIGVLDQEMEGFGRGLMDSMEQTEQRIASLSDTLGKAKSDLQKGMEESLTAQVVTGTGLGDVLTGKGIPKSLKGLSKDPLEEMNVGGFKDEVVGMWKDLDQELVGGSVIPEMIEEVGAQFRNLRGNVDSASRETVEQALRNLNELPDAARFTLGAKFGETIEKAAQKVDAKTFEDFSIRAKEGFKSDRLRNLEQTPPFLARLLRRHRLGPEKAKRLAKDTKTRERRQPIELTFKLDGKVLTRKVLELMPGEKAKVGLR